MTPCLLGSELPDLCIWDPFTSLFTPSDICVAVWLVFVFSTPTGR